MSKLRSKSKKLDLIVSEIAKIKANKALAAAVANAPLDSKKKKNPKRNKAPRSAAATKSTAAPTPRKRPELVKLPNIVEPSAKGSVK